MKDTYIKARKSFEEVSSLTLKQRIKLITNLKTVILNNMDSICDHIHKETNKPKFEALASEIYPTVSYCDFVIKNAHKILRKKTVPTPFVLIGKKCFYQLEPLGTILIISPWNFPFYLGMIPIISAFVTGNSIIYKPSEHTPLKNLFEKLFKLASFKYDWIQIVYGDGKVGQDLIAERPDKIFFTGSVAAGKKIMSQAAEQLIPLSLELGSKDCFVVFKDANLKKAASCATWGCFMNSGQVCTSIEKLYVHNSVYEQFKKLFLENVKNLILSKNGSNEVYDLGGVSFQFQKDKVKEQVDEALKKGASALLPYPTVLENVDKNASLLKDETFGPVIPLIKFESEEEIINEVNNSVFGLSANVWTNNKKITQRMIKHLKVGNMSINNVMITHAVSSLPFGGVKESGFGRCKGRVGLENFVNFKSVVIDYPRNTPEPFWFPYTSLKHKVLSSFILKFYSRGLLNKISSVVYGIKLKIMK